MENPKLRSSLRSVLFLVLLIATASPAPGQTDAPAEWGRVDPADLAMRYYPEDPSAPALVLSDYLIVGYSSGSDGFWLRSQRHRRVKYFERFAYQRDPVRIEWYDSLEQVSRLQARLYLPNGKVEKLRKKDFRLESLGGGWKQYVLELPKLPAGAILEYRYLLSSDYFDQLPVWSFQESYPIRRSEYRSAIPDWFDYVALSAPDSSLFSVYSQEGFALTRSPYGYIISNFNSSEYLRLVAESVPAIAEEPYTNNAFDHIPQLRRRLRSVSWPGEKTQNLYPTWPELADTLRKEPTFGSRYLDASQVGKVRSALVPRLREANTVEERVRLAYRAVAEHLTWDGTYSSESARGPDTVWAAGSGTSGELNLLLLAVLRDLGLPAFPVLVGTRDSGVPNEVLALREQFNHVLVLTQLDDRLFFLDVGDDFRPMGLPRTDALNNRGWLILDDRQQWLDLRVPPSEQAVVATLRMDTTGRARGELVADMTGYYAAFARERLQDNTAATNGPLVDVLANYYSETNFTRTLVGQEELEAPLRITLEGELLLAQREDDRLSFVPLLLPALTPDLLQDTPRQFPLDMPFPWSEQFRLVLDLPTGYTVETLPEAVRLRSADGNLLFAYSCLQEDGKLFLDFDLKLLDTFYSAKEFAALRELFYTAIERQEARLVLRRE